MKKNARNSASRARASSASSPSANPKPLVHKSDRWIIFLALAGMVALGIGWQIANMWLQLAGFVIMIFTTRLIYEHYGLWRAIVHFDIYMALSGFLFLATT